MLNIPDGYKKYTLISIDPGLSNAGIAIYNLSQYAVIDNITAFTIKPSNKDKRINLNEDIVGDRMIRLHSLKQSIKDLIENYQPSIVVHEGAFYSSFRPSAYGSLIETISYIKLGILEVTTNIVIDSLQPLLIKKIVGAGMTKGKIDVKKCLSDNKLIMDKLDIDLSELDEHAIDAIAIGYSYLKHIEIL